MLREAKDLGPYVAELLSMRPGMAGMWIAHGRNKLTFDERIRLELEYVRNWSLKLDFILFAKSLIALLMASGAH
jgi:lipopolysaccharide/colanic/teichoic acid biosynthesis glycosyltransferase